MILTKKLAMLSVAGIVAVQAPAMAQSVGVSGGADAHVGTNKTATDSPTGGNAGTGGSATRSIQNTGANNRVDWNRENDYWRQNYASRPYYEQDRDYSAYEPAYRYGVDTYHQNPGLTYEDLDQKDLERGWNARRGNSAMEWNEAQDATRDAYRRAYGTTNEGAGVSGDTSLGTTGNWSATAGRIE